MEKIYVKPNLGQIVTIGRMKGNISVNDKIYKISSKELFLEAKESYKNENRKIPLNCKVTIKRNEPISINITSHNNYDLYKSLNITYKLENIVPVESQNKPLEKETIIKQLQKTASTPYSFSTMEIDLDDNVFVPKLSSLNELRRNSLEQVQDYAIQKIQRKLSEELIEKKQINDDSSVYNNRTKTPKKALLLNTLNTNYDYSKLKNIDRVYIPFKFSLLYFVFLIIAKLILFNLIQFFSSYNER